MRAVLVVLSPGTSLPLSRAGRPATLYVSVLNVPVVCARVVETRVERVRSARVDRMLAI